MEKYTKKSWVGVQNFSPQSDFETIIVNKKVDFIFSGKDIYRGLYSGETANPVFITDQMEDAYQCFQEEFGAKFKNVEDFTLFMESESHLFDVTEKIDIRGRRDLIFSFLGVNFYKKIVPHV